MTFLTQKILFFKIESCLSLVDRFRIELSDTIFKIRKKIKNESALVYVVWERLSVCDVRAMKIWVIHLYQHTLWIKVVVWWRMWFVLWSMQSTCLWVMREWTGFPLWRWVCHCGCWLFWRLAEKSGWCLARLEWAPWCDIEMMLLVKYRASTCLEDSCDNPILPPSVDDNIVKWDRLQILLRWRALMAALARCDWWRVATGWRGEG